MNDETAIHYNITAQNNRKHTPGSREISNRLFTTARKLNGASITVNAVRVYSGKNSPKIIFVPMSADETPHRIIMKDMRAIIHTYRKIPSVRPPSIIRPPPI